MIKRIQTYERPNGNPFYADHHTTYRAVWFEDDQCYYRAVTWMRDQFGRAGARTHKHPMWCHDPNTLTISFRWKGDVVKFLVDHCEYKTVAITGHFVDNEVEEWAMDRGYMCEIFWDHVVITTPSERDHIFVMLRWAGTDHAEPVPW